MGQAELNFRQIHLDFHTSEAIEGIGADFEPEAFAETLEAARVNSVTCFARCHHGWIYYDSATSPERVHPHLERRELLGEQIEACHRRGIRVPVYTTVQWDAYTAREHPEWLAVDEEGRVRGTPPFEPGFYNFLMVNSPYVDWLKEHVRELLTRFDIDGLFFDIVQAIPDCSVWTRRAMIDRGLDPSDAEARRAFAVETVDAFKRDMTAFVRSFRDDCSIFYNAGHVGPRHRSVADAYTHFELESLPSGGWGYLHLPLAARYARRLGPDCMGMTGKFHTSWGDFHSFKNRPALEFECFQMLALGTKCSVGDQLPPRGRLCPDTYELVGSVYRQVEAKEPYCEGADPAAEIAVMSPEAFGAAGGGMPKAAVGAVRILQEGDHQFDMIDPASALDGYRLLVLPDEIPVDETLARKIEAFAAAGGAVLATGDSGLDPAGEGFALSRLGVRYEGPAPYRPDFVRPRAALGSHLPETEHVMHEPAARVAAAAGTTVLADAVAPYFNRTWRHYCSHRQTPSSGTALYPAAVRAENAIYFGHRLFTEYHRWAKRWSKQLALAAVNALLPDPLICSDGPSTLLVTLARQRQASRELVHLLHYIPERRGEGFDTIEDVIPLHGLSVSVRPERPVKGVRCVPEDRALEHATEGDRVTFTLPKLEGHQIVCLDHADGA